MLTQMQTKTKHHTRHTNRNPRVVFMAMLAAMLLPLASCINDNYDEEPAATSGTISVGLSIQTRSITNSGDAGVEYVAGSEWENYIDIANGDFRIYFFTNDKDDKTATSDSEKNTLIAEFTPTDIYATEGSNYVTYNLVGEVNEVIADYSYFKVMVIANWGTYPTSTDLEPGKTTIDDICNAGTFNAFVENEKAVMPSADRLIPFFGLREYSDVTWAPNRRTTLDGAITLLRAVAKVEVILDNEYSENNQNILFDNVTMMGYNSQGYCAPQNVYLQSDYDHNYTWSLDFVDGLHLVGGVNDDGATSYSMTFEKVQEASTTTQETWVCYLTEYDNTSNAGATADDYSYIQVTVEGVPYNIYFANYTNGGTTAYDTDGNTADRYDVYRNYLYRFHVTVSSLTISVYVEPWNILDEEVVDL